MQHLHSVWVFRLITGDILQERVVPFPEGMAWRLFLRAFHFACLIVRKLGGSIHTGPRAPCRRHQAKSGTHCCTEECLDHTSGKACKFCFHVLCSERQVGFQLRIQGGPGGPGPLAAKIFFLNHAVCRRKREKPVF